MLVFIDNYDSFSYNLVRYFEELNQKIIVFKNDRVTVQELLQIDMQAIIISPGPKTPTDSGVCLEIMKAFSGRIPILGICLGHQIIAHHHGCSVQVAPEPVHGKIATITHNEDPIFNKIPSKFKVTRYHSLVVKSGNEQVQVIAKTKDNLIMAIKVKGEKTYGLQFHPEAYLTEYGHQLLANFLKESGVSNE